jgi:hypothetical protein
VLLGGTVWVTWKCRKKLMSGINHCHLAVDDKDGKQRKKKVFIPRLPLPLLLIKAAVLHSIALGT